MKTDFDISRRPNVVPWPPILLGLGLIASIIMSSLAPLQLQEKLYSSWFEYPGLFLVLAGIGLDLWALSVMFSNGTNIQPHQKADKLVTSGPFSFSRNPIYLGNTLALMGIGLGFNHMWFVIIGLFHAIALYVLAIRREEAHLALRFKEEWDAYKERTPRWFGPF